MEASHLTLGFSFPFPFAIPLQLGLVGLSALGPRPPALRNVVSIGLGNFKGGMRSAGAEEFGVMFLAGFLGVGLPGSCSCKEH